jgi:hypothetical protein
MNFRRERQLDRELSFHIEQRIADFVAEGIAPEEARRRVRIEFGGIGQIKEECRDDFAVPHGGVSSRPGGVRDRACVADRRGRRRDFDSGAPCVAHRPDDGSSLRVKAACS